MDGERGRGERRRHRHRPRHLVGRPAATCSRRSTAPPTPTRCPCPAPASACRSPSGSRSPTAARSSVTSELGQGSTFRFTLPLRSPRAGRLTRRSASGTGRLEPDHAVHRVEPDRAVGDPHDRPVRPGRRAEHLVGHRARGRRRRGGPSARRARAPAGRPAAPGPAPAGRARRPTPRAAPSPTWVWMPSGRRVDPRAEAGPVQRVADLVVGRVGPRQADVLGDRGGEDVRVVVDEAHRAAYVVERQPRAGPCRRARTSPETGSMKRTSVAARVDLPEPEGPVMPTCSPGRRSRCSSAEHGPVGPAELRPRRSASVVRRGSGSGRPRVGDRRRGGREPVEPLAGGAARAPTGRRRRRARRSRRRGRAAPAAAAPGARGRPAPASTSAATATTPRPAAAVVRADAAATAREERRTAAASAARLRCTAAERRGRWRPTARARAGRGRPPRPACRGAARRATTSGSAAAAPAAGQRRTRRAPVATTPQHDEAGAGCDEPGEQRRRPAPTSTAVASGCRTRSRSSSRASTSSTTRVSRSPRRRPEPAGDERHEVGVDLRPALGELAQHHVVAEHALGVAQHRPGEAEQRGRRRSRPSGRAPAAARWRG